MYERRPAHNQMGTCHTCDPGTLYFTSHARPRCQAWQRRGPIYGPIVQDSQNHQRGHHVPVKPQIAQLGDGGVALNATTHCATPRKAQENPKQLLSVQKAYQSSHRRFLSRSLQSLTPFEQKPGRQMPVFSGARSRAVERCIKRPHPLDSPLLLNRPDTLSTPCPTASARGNA